MRAVIIGLGGIGSHLAEPLCRLLTYSQDSKRKDVPSRICLVDGDAYEEKNRQRQRYIVEGNKALATKKLLETLFPQLPIEAKPVYITPDNAFVVIQENDVVFLCVDNHATRKLVAEHVSALNNVLLVSGGNDETDGNVQIYWRVNGKDCSPSLLFQHPEIEHPKDRNPADIGCDEAVAKGSPQLLTVNMTIATLMLNSFALKLLYGKMPYHELYFDLKTGSVRPVKTTK